MAEENLSNTQALIRGAMFVRDGVDEDVCRPTLCITCCLLLFCRVQHGIWHLQCSLDLLLIFFIQDPLHYAVFFPKFLRKRFQSPLCLATTAVRNCFFLGTCSCVFYSYGLLSMNTLSREFNRTTTLNTPLTPSFLHS